MKKARVSQSDLFDHQAEFFQQSYRRLNGTSNVRHLAEIFGMVLLESFRFSAIAIMFQVRPAQPWEILFTTDESLEDCEHFFKNGNGFYLKLIENSKLMGCIHLPLVENARIGIVLGTMKRNTKFTNREKSTLQILLQQLTSAYQTLIFRQNERQHHFSQNHRIVQLTGLLDTSVEISRLQENSHILHMSLQKVLALTNASRGYLSIKSKDGAERLYHYPQKFDHKQQSGNFAITARFLLHDEVYNFYLYEKESRQGVVPFDSTDALLLQAFCRQVQVALENRFFHEQSLEKERMEHEILLAREIQKKIIPDSLPSIPGFDVAAIYLPARLVGGDFYDCIPLANNRFFFALADVAGKGVGAALLVNTFHAALHAHLHHFENVASIVKQLNRLIYESTTAEKYLTAVFILLDCNTQKIEWVNAGHNPFFYRRKDGQIEPLAASCLPLGFLPELPECPQIVLDLQAGDSLFLYTDGVTEAMNNREQEFADVKSLPQFINRHAFLRAKRFLSSLITEIELFTHGLPQADDISALYLKVES